MDESEPAAKRKHPIRKQDYKNYKNVLRSAKTVAEYIYIYKHLKLSAMQQ